MPQIARLSFRRVGRGALKRGSTCSGGLQIHAAALEQIDELLGPATNEGGQHEAGEACSRRPEALADLLRLHERTTQSLADRKRTARPAAGNSSGERGRRPHEGDHPRWLPEELRLLDPIDAALAAAAEEDPLPADVIRLRYVEGFPWPEIEKILQIWPEERAQLEERGMDRIGRLLMGEK